MTPAAMQRIVKEIRSLTEDPLEGIVCIPDESNLAYDFCFFNR